MRTLIAFAFVAALGVTAAHAQDSAQVAAKEPAAVTRTEPVTKAEAREIAKTWMQDNNLRRGRVGDIRPNDGRFLVEIQNADGIRLTTLKIDAATGKVSS
jgi:hypothetical protein